MKEKDGRTLKQPFGGTTGKLGFRNGMSFSCTVALLKYYKDILMLGGIKT